MAGEKYLVLARKWRPQAFEDVVGQEHITKTLQNAIASGRIGHAFLFIGSRGIGKTTTARILAKALNCLNAPGPTPHPCLKCHNCESIAAGANIDVVEIDGASNNSVEHVRDIRENVRLVPSSSRYKIYIIDEVHQLSSAAFNALLKTLEEPPPHAVFILATTEAHKVPATIISRCQRYDFRRVGLDRISELLRTILESEGITCDEQALRAIARSADGGIRDAESVLEQVISYSGKTIAFEDVFNVLGLVDWAVFDQLCDAILQKDIAKQLEIVEDVVASGKDLSQFIQDVLAYLRNLLVCKTADATALLALPEDDVVEMQRRADQLSLVSIIRLVEQFAELSKDFDSQLAQRIALETLLIRISKVSAEISVDTVIEKLVQLGAGGMGPVQPVISDGPESKKKARERPPVTAASGDAESYADDLSTRSRYELNVHNFQERWPAITVAARDAGMQLGVWLPHGRPVAIDDDTIVLEFDSAHQRSRAVLEKPENRRAIETVLTKLTTNIRTFRCSVREEGDSLAAVTAVRARAPIAGNVSVDAAVAALECEPISRMVDVFKGRIVEIKPTASR